MTTVEVQADIPETEHDELRDPPELKLRAYERIKLYPKVPIEPSAHGKHKSYSRSWILQDGRKPPEMGSEMRAKYKCPKKPGNLTGALCYSLFVGAAFGLSSLSNTITLYYFFSLVSYSNSVATLPCVLIYFIKYNGRATIASICKTVA